MYKRKQDGFHVVELLVVCLAVAIIAGVGYVVLTKNRNATTNGGSAKNGGSANFVEWSYNGSGWQAGGKAPQCESQLSIAAPMNVTQATSVLYPGQVRGGNYKPHGGFAIDNATDNTLQVVAVRDAYPYRGARYIEAGETQYMFDFMDPCGILYRVDHLATLSPELQKLADQLPPAKENSSQTEKFKNATLIKQGTVLATEVGFKANKNAAFDFGVYDLRQQNAVSKTEAYKNDQQRQAAKELSYFAVCWFDLLPADASSVVKALPSRDALQGKTSDYCK